MKWLNEAPSRDNMDGCYDYYCGNYNLDDFCMLRFCSSRGDCSNNNCAFYFG